MSGIRINGDGSTNVGGIDVNTPYEDDKGGVKVEDFLNLMIAQMTNQDFMNPTDDTQYVTQMAQFATMQAMQELSHYSQNSYVAGLVGKSVTVATLGLGGSVSSETGIVTKVNLSGDDYTITVNGKEYKLSQIMNVSSPDSTATQEDLDNAGKMTPVIMSEGKDSIKIRWDSPLTDEVASGELRYDVYYTTDGSLDFTNLAGVKKGEMVGQNMKDTELNITGLEPGKTYFINVVVRNQSGSQAVYQYAVGKTKAG